MPASVNTLMSEGYVCPQCGRLYAPRQVDQRWCSRDCSNRHHNARRADDAALGRRLRDQAAREAGQLKGDHTKPTTILGPDHPSPLQPTVVQPSQGEGVTPHGTAQARPNTVRQAGQAQPTPPCAVGERAKREAGSTINRTTDAWGGHRFRRPDVKPAAPSGAVGEKRR